MPNADFTEVAQPPSSADPAPVSRHRSMVLASAILATSGMLVTAAYGISNNLFVLWALALDMALAALAVWLCMNVCRIRRRAALAQQVQRTDVPADTSRVRFSRWADDSGESEGVGETPGLWDTEHARKLHYVFLALIPTAFYCAALGGFR